MKEKKDNQKKILFTKNNYQYIDNNKTVDEEYSETFRNIGFQVDTKLVMFSHLSSTLSFGWARAFAIGKDSRQFNEWMVSLKF